MPLLSTEMINIFQIFQMIILILPNPPCSLLRYYNTVSLHSINLSLETLNTVIINTAIISKQSLLKTKFIMLMSLLLLWT